MPSTPHPARHASLHIQLGILGLVWAVEIGINNVVAPPLPGRDTLDNSFWALIALGILIASFTLGDLVRHLGVIERTMFAENAQCRPSRYPGRVRLLDPRVRPLKSPPGRGSFLTEPK